VSHLFEDARPLLKNQLKLLESGIDAVVVFKVQDSTVKAHQTFLGENAPYRASQGSNNSRRLLRIDAPKRVHSAEWKEAN
jgi:hypothetical protein